MHTLKIKNFKAHKNLTIPLENKNFLLYGDNGSGKSSIYEALKILFYKNKIEKKLPQRARPEQRNEDIKEFWEKYNTTVNNPSINFDLKLSKDETQDINPDDYQVFMFNIDDLHFDNFLKLDDLLSKVFFDVSVSPTDYEVITTKVNTLLREKFLETIEITIESEDKSIKIKDTSKNIESTKDIKKYFNEAKLNLVILSILFIVIDMKQDESKKRVLVLDDFITSLDISNRTFIMKYVLETFSEKFQILIFTHNVYFYNLIMYLIDNIYQAKNKWKFANLYEMQDKSKIYFNQHIINLVDIKKELKKANPNTTQVGNDLRQKFERLLYEFSKLLMIGSVEESNKILENLFNHNKKYLFKENSRFKNSNDLIIEIEQKISTSGTIDDIKTLILKYSQWDDELDEIVKIIKELKIYQKVMMHSQSHGVEGINPIKEKEFDKTIELLEVFQTNIKDLQNKQMDGA